MRLPVQAGQCIAITLLLKYTLALRLWMMRYSGLLMTPQAMRGGAALDVPPVTA
jgi:hypothetical protein